MNVTLTFWDCLWLIVLVWFLFSKHSPFND